MENTTKNTREFISYQLKIKSDTWDKFRIKAIREKTKTLNSKLTEIIENYVRENVWGNLSAVPYRKEWGE